MAKGRDWTRRASPRIPFASPVTLIADGKTSVVRARDLGVGGLLVYADGELKVTAGDRIGVRFTIGGRHVEVTARVARTTDDATGVALAFLDLDSAASEALHAAIEAAE